MSRSILLLFASVVLHIQASYCIVVKACIQTLPGCRKKCRCMREVPKKNRKRFFSSGSNKNKKFSVSGLVTTPSSTKSTTTAAFISGTRSSPWSIAEVSAIAAFWLRSCFVRRNRSSGHFSAIEGLDCG